jgi:hypothetical protein
MLGAGHTKAKMVVRSRQVPESEVMRALVSSALISGIDAVDGFPPFHPNRGTLSAGSRGRAQ